MNLDWITFFLSVMSLIITIIGWTITYRNQKKLLDIQLIAERQKTILQFSIPHKLEQLKRIKQWRAMAHSLLLQANSIRKEGGDPEQELSTEYRTWLTQGYADIISFAPLLDPPSKPLSKNSFTDGLVNSLGRFRLLYMFKITNKLPDALHVFNYSKVAFLNKYEIAEMQLEDDLLRIEQNLIS